MDYDDPFPPYLRQAMEEAARIQKLFGSSGISRIVEKAAETQRQYERAIGAAGLGALDHLAAESRYAAKILGENTALKAAVGHFSAALKPVFPEWLGSVKLPEAARIAGIGSDLALASSQFKSVNDSILGRFEASNAVLMGLDKPRLAALTPPLNLPGDGALATLKSTMADVAPRDVELWRNVSGYHIASELAVARIEETFAAHEHWASLGALKDLNVFTTAYDRLVGDLAVAANPNSLLQQVPAELFGHATLLDLFRDEPDLEETEEAREGFVDETRREFRMLVEDRHPELLEYVRAADEARASRGPGWAAAFCLALRRLIEHAYEIVAPIGAVRAWPIVVDVASGKNKKLRGRLLQPSGTPTMFARILFATNSVDPRVDVSLPTFVGTDFNGVKRTLGLLNRHIHEFSVSVDEAALDLAQARAERYTLFVLRLPSKDFQ